MQHLGWLVVLIQVVFAVHVIKTGRSFWWLWLIILMPGIGCLVYFIVEVLPDLHRSPTIRRVGSDIVTVVDPGRNLRKLQEELEISDTFKNRQMLARGYMKAGSVDEAIEMYKSCLTGIFKDDPSVMLELAFAYFLEQAYPEAKQMLDQLIQSHPEFRPPERRLLYARTLEQSGETDRALEEYAGLVRISSGEETRCRYALLLDQNGDKEKAQEIFREIIRRAKRSPRYYRRAQREWVNIAKQNVVRSDLTQPKRLT